METVNCYLYIVWLEVPDEYTSRLITTSTSAGMPESRAFSSAGRIGPSGEQLRARRPGMPARHVEDADSL
jgi:hypothetical protein